MEGHVPIVVTIDPPVEPPYECGFGCDFQLTSNGTEDILVCNQCGRVEPLDQLSQQSSNSKKVKDVRRGIGIGLMRTLRKEVQKTCQKFKLGKSSNDNMYEFLVTLYQKGRTDNKVKVKMNKANRRAALALYASLECRREDDSYSLKDICSVINKTFDDATITMPQITSMKYKIKLMFPELMTTFKEPYLLTTREKVCPLIVKYSGNALSREEMENATSMAIKLFDYLVNSVERMRTYRNQPTLNDAVVVVVLRYFESLYKVKCKDKGINPAPFAIPEASCRTIMHYVYEINKELLQISLQIPYIDDTVRTAKRIHTVLDSILNFIEVPEVDDSALDKESSTEKPDTKLLEYRRKLIELSRHTSDDILENLNSKSKDDLRIIKELLNQREVDEEMIKKWPATLSELLHFHKEGDMNNDEEELQDSDLMPEEEMEYILNNDQLQQKEQLWEVHSQKSKKLTKGPKVRKKAGVSQQKTVNKSNQSEVDSPSHSEVDSPSHSKVDSPCHSEVDSPSHSEVDSPCHSEVDSPSHSEVDSPCHSEVDSPSHSEVDSPSHSEVDSPCHSEVDSPHQYDTASSDLPDRDSPDRDLPVIDLT